MHATVIVPLATLTVWDTLFIQSHVTLYLLLQCKFVEEVYVSLDTQQVISGTSLSSQSLGYGTDKTNLQQPRLTQETPKTKPNKTKLALI